MKYINKINNTCKTLLMDGEYHSLLTIFSSMILCLSAPKHPRNVIMNVRDPTEINRRAGSVAKLSTISVKDVIYCKLKCNNIIYIYTYVKGKCSTVFLGYFSIDAHTNHNATGHLEKGKTFFLRIFFYFFVQLSDKTPYFPLLTEVLVLLP